MCLPSRSACFFLSCSRQRLRFSLTSRIPTVICVGRSDRIDTGCTLGSRALVMVEGPFTWLQRLVQVPRTMPWALRRQNAFSRLGASYCDAPLHAKGDDGSDI